MFRITSKKIQLHGVADSFIGGREENQDDIGFLDTPFGFLFIVCDGMGGGPGGKTASYIVKYEIAKALSECDSQMPRENVMKMAASKANDVLSKKMKEMPALIGMGSTFVAILISEQSAIITHAGDSRCYRIRGKRVLFRTHDHSLVGELVSKKILTEEQARISPQANIITRGLGSITNHIPDVEEVPYRRGDRFVLCTDGVWGSMPHKELLKRFSSKVDGQLMVSNLAMEINGIGKAKGGHHDNFTFGMIDMDCHSTIKDKWTISKIITFTAIIVAISIMAVLTISKIVGNGGHDTTSANVNGGIATGHQQGMQVSASSRQISDSGNLQNDTTEKKNVRAIDINKRAILRGIIRERSNDSTGESGRAASPDKRNTKKSSTPQTKAVEMLQTSENILDSMKSLRSTKQEVLKRKKRDYYTQVRELFRAMRNLDLAEHKQKLEDITAFINKNRKMEAVSDSKDSQGLYHSSNEAVMTINSAIKKIRELKTAINGNNNKKTEKRK